MTENGEEILPHFYWILVHFQKSNLNNVANSLFLTTMATKSIDWLKIIFDISDKLTIKKILATLLSGIFISSLYVSYENREDIFKYIVQHGSKESASSNWEVSEQSKIELVTLSSNSQLVKLVSVNSVDLQLNRQEIKYWFIDIDTNIELPDPTSILPYQVFDANQENTNRVVSVLGNEFVCFSSQDSIYEKYSKDIPVICKLAIPPFYGRFVGILTFGLSRMPDVMEKDSLKLEASRLAVEIYLRDITKQK